MYAEHPSFPQVEDGKLVWRYMDIGKFISLLSTEQLFFTRPCHFHDPYEGRTSLKNLDTDFINSTAQKLADQVSSFNLSEKVDIRKLKADVVRCLASAPQDVAIRNQTAVSCWSLFEQDAEFLWRIYTSSPNGLAIRTTVGNLKEAFKEEERNIHVGKVSYLDYESDAMPLWNDFYMIMHKRICYEYEKELRAVAWEPEPIPRLGQPRKFSTEHGEYIKVDLQRLIGAVFISPYSDSWFADAIKAVVKKFGFAFPIEESNLLTLPPDFVP